LSDDELQEDEIRLKGKMKGSKGRKKNKKEESEEEEENDDEKLEEDPDYVFETNMSFQQMNLSRPLLKVHINLAGLIFLSCICSLKSCHNHCAFLLFTYFLTVNHISWLCSSYTDPSCCNSSGAFGTRYLWLCSYWNRQNGSLYAASIRATPLQGLNFIIEIGTLWNCAFRNIICINGTQLMLYSFYPFSPSPML
jgi:hypothetical protein